MAIFQTYDMKGLKLSFANWVSCLSPTDTPFVSMTGKESIDQVKYQWQTDSLSPAAENAVAEGSEATDGALRSTVELENYTQILRKAVRVTDSAKATGLYGRSNELKYQMEKAGMEIKRDLEYMFLNAGAGTLADANSVRTTSGFRALVGVDNKAAKGLLGSKADTDTGAVVVAETAAVGIVTEKDLFDLTMQLYIAGAKVDTVMFHPKYMAQFSTLLSTGKRKRLFKNLDDKFNLSIKSIKDPLGQELDLVPNRFMPENAIYFFNSKDWTQMIFRNLDKTQLAKNGSNEKWMIELEVGLRHRNPYASGVLYVKGATVPANNAGADGLNETQADYLVFAYGITVGGAGDLPAKKAAIKTFFALADAASTVLASEAPTRSRRSSKKEEEVTE